MCTRKLTPLTAWPVADTPELLSLACQEQWLLHAAGRADSRCLLLMPRQDVHLHGGKTPSVRDTSRGAQTETVPAL